MMPILAVCFALAGSVMLGRAAVRVMLPASAENTSPPAEIWGLSIVLGVGLTGWLSFLWAFSHGTLSFIFSATLAGIGMLAGLWATIFSTSKTVHRKIADSNHLVKSCQWIIALLIGLAFVQTALTPQRFWDERAIFAIKAKVIFEEGTINNSTLDDADFVQYHPKYPLMLPLLEQHIYALLGDEQDRWSKLWFPFLYAGLVLTFTGVCTRHFGSAWAWTCGLLLATAPVLMPDEYGFLSAQADAPVACFHGITVLYLWDALSGSTSATKFLKAAMAGFIASCAAFTKDEGIAFLMIDVLSCGIAMTIPIVFRRRSPISLMLLIVFALTASLMLTPWFLHRHRLPDTTEMHYAGRLSTAMLYERLDTLKWSLPHVRHRMFGEWRQWGLHWWAGLLAIVTRPRRAMKLPQIFLILNLLGALAALLVAGMLAPAELEEHLGGASHRYLMQLVPVVMLLVASLWSKVGEEKTEGRSARNENQSSTD